MEYGHIEEWALKQAEMHGLPLPQAIRDAPKLLRGLELFWEGFMNLHSCRQIGMGFVGPISWLAIIAYCNEFGLEGEQREAFIHHIQGMDSAYVSWQAKKMEVKTK